MSDLIERQAAIDAIANCTNCGDEKTLRAYVAKHNLDNGWTGGILEAIDAIEDLPSAQPEPHWVPCSERLPKKDGRYQVTRYDYVTNTEFIDILWYEENLWWNRHSTGNYAVTAWMPLPELYKGEQHERSDQ